MPEFRLLRPVLASAASPTMVRICHRGGDCLEAHRGGLPEQCRVRARIEVRDGLPIQGPMTLVCPVLRATRWEVQADTVLPVPTPARPPTGRSRARWRWSTRAPREGTDSTFITHTTPTTGSASWVRPSITG